VGGADLKEDFDDITILGWWFCELDSIGVEKVEDG
jgi:hypothetical protein